MPDSIQRLQRALASQRPATGITGRIQQNAIRHRVEVLLENLESINSGHFEVRESVELLELVLTFLSESGPTHWSVSIGHYELMRCSAQLRKRLLSILSDLLGADYRGLTGTADVHCLSVRALIEDATLLRLALQGSSHGLTVQALAADSRSRPACSLILTSASGCLMVTSDSAESGLLSWSVKLDPAGSRELGEPSAAGVHYNILSLDAHPDDTDRQIATTERLTIRDVFGELICLRDLEPRVPRPPGLASLRSELHLAKAPAPRKNEPAHARLVGSFVTALAGPQARILYVGDSVLTDGSAICNLDALFQGAVAGFLCNERGFGHPTDFQVGPILFSRRWRSLVHFVAECGKRRISIDDHLVALVDLDQTVYAAKGRDDQPLFEARWEAMQGFLRDTIPTHRFDAARAQAMYRKFDSDDYHAITLDNLDYVVVLVLASVAGILELSELDSFTSTPGTDLSELTKILYDRASARADFEDLGKLTAVLRAIHYNTLAGDQTPCKDFRLYECRAMARRMRDGGTAPLALNREVVDFVRFLRSRGAAVLAVSDRPPEATVIEADESHAAEDILSIPMPIAGHPIYEGLRRYA